MLYVYMYLTLLTSSSSTLPLPFLPLFPLLYLPPPSVVAKALTSRSQELDRLKGEWSSHTASLSSEHMAQLTAERERALQTQTEAQARHEREKKELEHSQSAKVCSALCGEE